jgi:hypothetical protein
MQLASARHIYAANRSRATELSIAGALRLLGNKKPEAGKSGTKRSQGVLSSLAWSEASLEERRRFLDAVGLTSWLQAMPPSWRATVARHMKAPDPDEFEKRLATLLRVALAGLAQQKESDKIEPETRSALDLLNKLISDHGHDVHEIFAVRFDRSQTIEKRARAKAA